MDLRRIKMMIGWSTTLILAVLALGAECLRDVRIEIHPEQVAAGDTVTIECLYDLEGAPLYAMKLYKGRREIYRYVPSMEPSSRVFPFLGMEVDLSESNGHRVVLKRIDRRLGGRYGCEVSLDAPSFSTTLAYKELTVAVLPTSNPMLHTEKSKYEVGDLLVASCTAALSRPAANLTFYINELPVPESAVRNHDPRAEMASSSRDDSSELPLESSSVGLELRLQRFHFRPGRTNRLYCQQRVLDLSIRNSEPFILSYAPTEPPTTSPPPREETVAEPVPERVTSPSHATISARYPELPLQLSLVIIAHQIFKVLALR